MTGFAAAARATYDVIPPEYARRWDAAPEWVRAELDRHGRRHPVACGQGAVQQVGTGA
ncbi:hypothetical protein [Streptomyces sp. NPDC001292]|uniref:hypothetical protein n=1 Tax=Streptomyces sp. NPDC001292 TaxID=3364558 RepID=UPI0036B38C35